MKLVSINVKERRWVKKIVTLSNTRNILIKIYIKFVNVVQIICQKDS